jgi:hypothetical protein
MMDKVICLILPTADVHSKETRRYNINALLYKRERGVHF